MLSLLESGHFSWKPTWHVHTTQACIDNFATKMAACLNWNSGEAKNSNICYLQNGGRPKVVRQCRPVYAKLRFLAPSQVYKEEALL